MFAWSIQNVFFPILSSGPSYILREKPLILWCLFVVKHEYSNESPCRLKPGFSSLCLHSFCHIRLPEADLWVNSRSGSGPATLLPSSLIAWGPLILPTLALLLSVNNRHKVMQNFCLLSLIFPRNMNKFAPCQGGFEPAGQCNAHSNYP